LVLKPDRPIHGLVRNEQGEPISDIEVSANGIAVKTDQQGRFVLRGLGEDATFQLKVFVDGYAPIDWGVTATPDGFEYVEVGEKPSIAGSQNAEAYKKAMEEITVRVPSLQITLQREAQIQGHVVDAVTNEPVTISRIVLCTFTRKENGEVVLDGCRIPRFAQPEPGRFSVGYFYPTEYHLTVSAEGYDDAEAFTPRVDSLEPINGIVVRMRRKSEAAESGAKLNPQIRGIVTDEAIPLEGARIALWTVPQETNAVNAKIVRRRTTTGDGYVFASQPLDRGSFSLDVPYQSDDWYLLVETPRRIVALKGPIAIGAGETKSVELKTRASGGLREPCRITRPSICPCTRCCSRISAFSTRRALGLTGALRLPMCFRASTV
jgi:hypothetical protein